MRAVRLLILSLLLGTSFALPLSCPSLSVLTPSVETLNAMPMPAHQRGFQHKTHEYNDGAGHIWRIMLLPDLAQRQKSGLYRADWLSQDQRVACAYGINKRDLMMVISQFSVRPPTSEDWKAHDKHRSCLGSHCQFSMLKNCRYYSPSQALGAC